MGFFDHFSFDNLDDPNKLGLLAMGLSMIAPKPYKTGLLGDIGSSGLEGLQTLVQAKQQERTNRTSDLQQLTGLQNALYANEFPRMLQMGSSYTPSPDIQTVNSRINDLVSKMNLSGGKSAARVASAPPALPALPPPVPGVAAPSTSPMASPDYQPPSAAVRPDSATPAPAAMPAPQSASPQAANGGIPSSAYGIPAPLFMAAGRAGPGALALLQAMVKSRQPMTNRPGATQTVWDEATQSVKPVFYAPKLDAGIQPTFGPNGQVSASPVPGYADTLAGIKSAETTAGEVAKAPFTVVPVPGSNRQVFLSDVSPYFQRNYPVTAPQGQSQPQPQGQGVARVDVTQPSRQSQYFGNQGSGISGPDPVTLAGAKSGAESVNKVYGDAYGEIRKAGTDAPYQTALLNEMLALTQGALKGQTGAFMPMRQKWTEYLTSAGVPQKAIDALPGTITNLPEAQDFVKLAMQRAMSQTRTLGAREAASVFNQVQQANPNTSLTSDAMARILQPLLAEQQWNAQKFQAADQWLQSRNGNLAGFESAWQREHPFTEFWKGSEQAKAQTDAASRTTVRLPNGKAYEFPSAEAAQRFKQHAGIQ